MRDDLWDPYKEKETVIDIKTPNNSLENLF